MPRVMMRRHQTHCFLGTSLRTRFAGKLLGRLRWPGAAMLVAVATACLAVGCTEKKEQVAGQRFRRALREHRKRFAAFQRRYAPLERRVASLRHGRPKAAADLVRREMIPLLQALVEGFAPVIRSGRAYVRALPESLEARKSLRKQIRRFERQKRLLGLVLSTYREEARLLQAGTARSEDLQVLYDRRLDAARRLERGVSRRRAVPRRAAPAPGVDRGPSRGPSPAR